MRILIVGSDKIYAIENFYRKYLEEQNVEVRLFTAQNLFYDYYNRSVMHKFIFRLGLSGITSKINKVFRRQTEHFKPHIIWIFKGMEITPTSLTWAKGKDVKLVNYNPDNPFIFSGRGSGNKNITRSIPLYDLHFTYNLSVKERLENEYGCRTFFLPFGFDLNEESYDVCVEQREINKLCFAGNPDKERAVFIEKMAKAGIHIDVFGNNWDRFVSHPLINIYPPAYGLNFWKILRRYRVQLNLMRIHNLDSHNMRTFEVPGVGGIMLAPDTREHRLFFKDKESAFFFTDVQDAIMQTIQILQLSDHEANKIRQNARTVSLRSGYSYKDRANQALKALTELIS